MAGSGCIIYNTQIDIAYGMQQQQRQRQRQRQRQSVQQMLTRLKIKSIEELLSSDTINVDNISKSTSLHTIAVEKLLQDIRSQLNGEYTNGNNNGSNSRLSINLGNIILAKSNTITNTNQQQGECILHIEESEIVEILGRAGSGKTWLINRIIVQCLKEGYSVIHMDSHHHSSLKESIKKMGSNSLRFFHFENLSELCMLLHIIGNKIIHERKENKKKKYILCIDSITQLDSSCNSNTTNTTNNQPPLDYSGVEKLKRLLVEFSNKCCPILFTNQAKNNFTLFHTHYRNQIGRPLRSLSFQKIWDSFADKTICVDYAQTQGSPSAYTRVYFSKGMHSKIYEYQYQYQFQYQYEYNVNQ